MERKIGEIFEYNGEWYQCVIGYSCNDCAFNKKECSTIVDNDNSMGNCCADRRKDNKDVIFKKLEKVGEPFFVNIQGNNVLEQRYKLYEPMVTLKEYWYRIDGNFINIEIKQNQENMEENYKAEDTLLTRLVGRYVNNLIDYETFEKAVKELYSDKKDSKPVLKEFDLEAAKAGKPVCTRDGRKAIFLTTLSNKNFPVVAIVSCGQEENVYQYDINGVCDEHDDNLDLMMLPERKEGWINIYNADTTFYYADGRVFETKDEAVQEAKEEVEKEQREKNEYIDTIRVEWEE